ncbi:MAG: hypothetical protein C7B47_03425 [Sulfobacillus thermosulfidooxidans]|uniref:Uncharacterized protein n=1 Tax=Sulfobacillus thermosulfidooxidans TaxID=28034 RepID=A0A2T2X3C6_SULTH|nr:MAG: hypothetical protein C7B47_03425 [Sulfobacillus thermosulfidooxidans]
MKNHDIEIPTTLDTVWSYVQDRYANQQADHLDSWLIDLGERVTQEQNEWQKPDDWLAYQAWSVAEDNEKPQLAHLFMRTVGHNTFDTEQDVRH